MQTYYSRPITAISVTPHHRRFWASAVITHDDGMAITTGLKLVVIIGYHHQLVLPDGSD